MQEIKGHKNTAYVYADDIEQEAVNQVHAFLDSPAAEGGRIAIMPDVHAGAGCVVGFTQELGGDAKVVPNLVGVDIGCGVSAVALDATKVDFDRFDKYLRANVPSGFNIRESVRPIPGWAGGFVDQIKDIVHRIWPEMSGPQADEKVNSVMRSIGTLGGGNHFIEINKGEDDRLWLVVHTGSRNFGLQVAHHHQKIAEVAHGKMGGLAYLEGDLRDQYLLDMMAAQELADWNRTTIIEILASHFTKGPFILVHEEGVVESVHNYISKAGVVRPRYIRKGAISAYTGERVIVPLNMAEGCIIGTGKGNADWNWSAPHGAGRRMSRGDARRGLKLDRFERVMKDAGVWSSCVNEDTLDEAPMAYKRSEGILASLKDTVDIEQILKPIYNFKASEKSSRKDRKSSRDAWKKEQASREAKRAARIEELRERNPDFDEIVDDIEKD
jgi:tRNA-splicing ligase RtcB